MSVTECIYNGTERILSIDSLTLHVRDKRMFICKSGQRRKTPYYESQIDIEVNKTSISSCKPNNCTFLQWKLVSTVDVFNVIKNVLKAVLSMTTPKCFAETIAYPRRYVCCSKLLSGSRIVSTSDENQLNCAQF